jgi:pimeloyl-ACP methyl ester carboxylesterase
MARTSFIGNGIFMNLLRPEIFDLLVLSLVPALLFASCSTRETAGVSLSVFPENVVAGDPVVIRVTNLPPGVQVAIEASGTDQYGQTWSSSAVYAADANGTVDLSRDAPVSGSYAGVSQAGLFWSMAPDPAAKHVTPMVGIESIAIAVKVGGVEAARGAVSLSTEVELDVQTVTGDISGKFYIPKGAAGPFPAMIVLGGSEGGAMQGIPGILASKLRRPVLALSYFDPGANPPTYLQDIAIEYFEKAFDWLDSNPLVKRDSFVLYGVSRGAELSLLLASMFPDRVRGVVGNMPSSVLWAGEGKTQGAPAWVYQGRPLPYINTEMSEQMYGDFMMAAKSGTPYAFKQVYQYSLGIASALEVEAASVKIENAAGPVLMIGSDMDGVWMSSQFAETLSGRLKSRSFKYPVENLGYPCAGHFLFHGYMPATVHKLNEGDFWMDLGGTTDGIGAASTDAWPRTIDFLERTLKRLED